MRSRSLVTKISGGMLLAIISVVSVGSVPGTANAGALGYVAAPFVMISPNGAPALMDMQVGSDGRLEVYSAAQVGLDQFSPGIDEHGSLFADVNHNTQTVTGSNFTPALPDTDFVRSFSYDTLGRRVVIESGTGPVHYIGEAGSDGSVAAPAGWEVSDNPWGSGNGMVLPLREFSTGTTRLHTATRLPVLGAPVAFGPALNAPGGDAFVNGNQTGVRLDPSGNVQSITTWVFTVTPDPPNPIPLFQFGLFHVQNTTSTPVVTLDFFDDLPASNPLAIEGPSGEHIAAGVARNLVTNEAKLYLNDQTATDEFSFGVIPNLEQVAIHGFSDAGNGKANILAATLTTDHVLRRWTFEVDLDPAGPTINLVNNELLLDAGESVNGQTISDIFLDHNGIDSLGNIVIRVLDTSGNNYFGSFASEIPEPATLTLFALGLTHIARRRPKTKTASDMHWAN